VRAWLRSWEGTVALLLIAGVYSQIQATTPNIVGIDGYYHVKVAALMREQGWRFLAPLDFPWLQITILGPGRYSDHHFLFHVLQVPFTVGDLRIGAKMAAVLFAILGLYTTYLFLARFRVRYPLLWILVLIGCAPTFLWRQSMARTQSLSVFLIVAGLWALFAGRPRWLLVVGFLAALLFNGFFFVLGAPVAAVLASVVLRFQPIREDIPDGASAEGETAWPTSRTGRRSGRVKRLMSWLRRDPAWAALFWTLAGLGLGLLAHPYFPRNVEFAFFHLLPKALPGEQPNVSVGDEWYPYSLRGFIVRAGPSAVATVLGPVPLGLAIWRRERLDWRALVLGALAFGFLAMVARSQRLIEYFPAFALVFCAWTWTKTPALDATLALLGARFPGRLRWGGARLRPLAPWLALLILGPYVMVSTIVAGREAQGGLAWDTYRDGARWLAANTPTGARVFTTDWDDFPHMFFWNTHNTYLVGLDPTYFSLEDPDRYRLWRAIVAGQVPTPSRAIHEGFGATYVLTDLRHRGFIGVADADPDLEPVLRTPTVIVYRVRGG
jgi:hypothetical protein